MDLFESTVAGIPCRIEVTHYVGPTDWRQHTFAGAGPGDCDPPQDEEFEYQVLDRKGYPAPWLERKLTHEDAQRFLTEYIETRN